MGELQKRIEKQFEVAYETCYSKLAPKNDAECAGLINTGLKPNVLEIVGLMIKEFPILTNEGFLMFHADVLKWKKRWLMPTAQKSKSEEKK